MPLSQFPLGKTGGLIEAFLGLHSWPGMPAMPFPLGKTGGLIEAPAAGFCLLVNTKISSCFRWVKPAASLKQDHGNFLLWSLL